MGLQTTALLGFKATVGDIFLHSKTQSLLSPSFLFSFLQFLLRQVLAIAFTIPAFMMSVTIEQEHTYCMCVFVCVCECTCVLEYPGVCMHAKVRAGHKWSPLL